MQVFYVYSHKDETLRDELETHLSLLRREGLIENWHDRKIGAGKDWEGEIVDELGDSGVILLLVSADFLASEYCWGREMTHALQRHEYGTARVIPVILRECDWTHAPFAKLQALPKDALPITSWDNRDSAWTNVAKGIRQAVTELSVPPPTSVQMQAPCSVGRIQASEVISLVSLEVKITEKNNSWWRYSWQLSVANRTSKRVKFDLTLDYLDEQEFVLDRSDMYGLILAPSEARTFREFALIGKGNAERVRTLEPRFKVTSAE